MSLESTYISLYSSLKPKLIECHAFISSNTPDCLTNGEVKTAALEQLAKLSKFVSENTPESLKNSETTAYILSSLKKVSVEVSKHTPKVIRENLGVSSAVALLSLAAVRTVYLQVKNYQENKLSAKHKADRLVLKERLEKQNDLTVSEKVDYINMCLSKNEDLDLTEAERVFSTIDLDSEDATRLKTPLNLVRHRLKDSLKEETEGLKGDAVVTKDQHSLMLSYVEFCLDDREDSDLLEAIRVIDLLNIIAPPKDLPDESRTRRAKLAQLKLGAFLKLKTLADSDKKTKNDALLFEYAKMCLEGTACRVNLLEAEKTLKELHPSVRKSLEPLISKVKEVKEDEIAALEVKISALPSTAFGKHDMDLVLKYVDLCLDLNELDKAEQALTKIKNDGYRNTQVLKTRLAALKSSK